MIVTSNLEFGQWNRIFGDNRLTSALVTVWSIMPTLLHLREKAIVYAMRCLLETLKLLFKNRVASLCTFRRNSLYFLLAQNKGQDPIFIPSIYSLYIGEPTGLLDEVDVSLSELENHIDVTISSPSLMLNNVRYIVGEKSFKID